MIACAASVVGGEYRLSVGARPGRALLLLDEEGLLSEGLTEDSIENFAMWAEKHISTGSNHRAGAKYRSRLIRVLCQRLLNKLREEQKWR